MLDELNVKFTLSQGRPGSTTALHWLIISVKCLFRQLLEGIWYLHKNEIVHR